MEMTIGDGEDLDQEIVGENFFPHLEVGHLSCDQVKKYLGLFFFCSAADINLDRFPASLEK